MNARTRRTRGPDRSLVQALLVLAGLAATVAGFVWFARADIRVYAYRNAPACSAAEQRPGASCVRHETGRVTAKNVHPGAGPGAANPSAGHTVTVARAAAPERGYEVPEAFYDRVRVGAEVDLTVYRGRVAALTHQGHRTDNQDVSYLVSFGVPLLIGLGSAVTTHGLAWSRPGPRAARFGTVAVITLVLAFIGSLCFVSLPMPSAVLVTVPVLLWLITTAACTALARNF
ncbi:hypothetical protein SAMN05216371_7560 [Streptomyces sp. TLI_053]|uniref:hypothetical protein n=1 Tax=Streptomyces sp. TLI_053 TaxID=1855352 RepID=UPI000879F74D|nr:hypothetical protein [Streptomyces sp. TLI_053]SDT82760.1 hypothetical protein SAMN05216371_7560 [Streptomyces sp. TLI_053]